MDASISSNAVKPPSVFRAAETGDAGTSKTLIIALNTEEHESSSTAPIPPNGIESQSTADRWQHMSAFLFCSWTCPVGVEANHFESDPPCFRCIRHLLNHGANPSLENHLGVTSWKNLSQLSEPLQLECLREFLSQDQKTVVGGDLYR